MTAGEIAGWLIQGVRAAEFGLTALFLGVLFTWPFLLVVLVLRVGRIKRELWEDHLSSVAREAEGARIQREVAGVLESQYLEDEIEVEGARLVHERCGTLVMYYDHVPRIGEILLSRHATWPDGTRPGPHDLMSCEACARPVEGSELAVRPRGIGDGFPEEDEN